MTSHSTHYRACNLCEAICGLEIKVADGEIVSIRGDKADPLSRGHICAKAVALQDLHADPDRLKRPLRRKGNDFEEIGWDEALDETASRLNEIRRRHGHEALALYLGNPNVHNWGSILYGPLLFKALAPHNRYAATSVDQLPHHLAAYLMFGHQLLLPIPDIDRTDFLLILGGNPVVSNGSIMTVPDVKKRLRAIRERGGKVVTVDPRRTETALLADQHYFIRPGTDALLLAAIIHTILAEDLGTLGPLGAHVDGIESVETLVQPFTPDVVEQQVGIPASHIRGLARDFCAAGSAVAHGRLGLSIQKFGGLCQWLVNVLNIITGNLDRTGGAMFTRPAVDMLDLFTRGGYDRFRSRVRGLPEFGGELPVATMAEDMLADGDGRIRALLTIAGNPVISTPNGRRLDQALAGLDFMASIDFYVNETTRHADIILPPTAALEHDHYDVVFNLLAIRNTARYSPAVYEPAVDARHDWQIYLELAGRLQHGSLPGRLKGLITRWRMRQLGPTGVLGTLLRRGPYSRTLTLEKLLTAEHGVDLGPLDSCLPARLRTSNKRIDLAPETITRDMTRLENQLTGLATSGEQDGTLLLIGRRQPRSNNSWMHNFPRLVKGKNPCTLLIHPRDAESRGLRDGQKAAVLSRTGRVTAPVQVSDEMMPGVVSLPHGWGHNRPGVRLGVASAHAGVSINDLTDELQVDELSGNAALSGVEVTVAAAEKQ